MWSREHGTLNLQAVWDRAYTYALFTAPKRGECHAAGALSPRSPSPSEHDELLRLSVSGTRRRNVLGAIASAKNDCNFP
jgi:hypothetical protein